MASSSAQRLDPRIPTLKDELYDACAEFYPESLVSMDDLLGLGIIPNNDASLLMGCNQALMGEGLFKTATLDGTLVFRVIKREDAARFRTLSAEEDMVFSHVEAAGQEGIWIRTMRMRTQLHQTVVTRCLKTLESKGFIKSIQSVKYPTRKIYMLASLTPSEDITGGPWFTDGELDTEFVKVLCNTAMHCIWARSFYRAPAPPGVSTPAPGSSKRRKLTKAAAERATTLETGGVSTPSMAGDELLPFPPTYKGYPTLPEVMSFVNESNVTSIPLAEEHVRQLLDILYFDKRVERVLGGTAFRAVRDPPLQDQPEGPGARNALTEAPCGRCPVFSLCGEGGPVSASSCEYFEEWLGK